MVWIHYSKKSIEKLLDDDTCIYQQLEFKPEGLWLSKDSEWLEYAKIELPERFKNINYIYKISIKKNSNLLKISSFKDLEIFQDKYMIKTDWTSIPNFWDITKYESSLYLINWIKVCQDYDGIIFTNYKKILEKIIEISKNNKHNMTKFLWYHSLDINSACIFRPSKIVSKFELIYKN
jgi:hypothetical protein